MENGIIDDIPCEHGKLPQEFCSICDEPKDEEFAYALTDDEEESL